MYLTAVRAPVRRASSATRRSGFLSIISAGHAPSRQIRYTNGPHGCPAVQIGAPTHDRRYYRSPTSSAIEQVSRTKTTTGCSQLVTPFLIDHRSPPLLCLLS